MRQREISDDLGWVLTCDEIFKKYKKRRARDQVSSLGELEFTDLSFLCETTSPSPFMSLNYYSE